MNHRLKPFRLLLPAAVAMATATAARAQAGATGHQHGPDGRHIAAPPPSGSPPGTSILSHHDLLITDTSKFSPKTEGAVVEGADVHSVIHKKGDPRAVVHRERNAFEPETGVYGSHMVYREPGEYVIVENVSLPDGRKYVLEFPIWVPGPSAQRAPASGSSPLLLGIVGLAVFAAIAAAFLLGRRSGRRAAAGLGAAALLAGPAVLPSARAQEEAGHMHGPDGRHIAVAGSFGGKPGAALRAYLGPNREIEGFQTRDHYRFRLSIENEELGPPDPDVVTLPPENARAVGLTVVEASARPLAGGLSATGQVRRNPDGVVTVSSRVAGRILRVNVTPGQRIAGGHLVAVIDSTEVAEAHGVHSRTRAELRQAEAAGAKALAEVERAHALMAEAQAGLDRVRAQRAEYQAEEERARADLGVARSRADSARQTLARQQQLAAAGAFAQGPVESARSAVALAEGELREAQAALAGYEAQARRLEQGLKDGVVARREVEVAQTAVVQGRARVATVERRLLIERAALAREERIQGGNLRDAREVETARAEADAAQLGVRSAEAALARQQKAVEAADALVAAQQRALDSARAQVRAARSESRAAEAAVGGAMQAVRTAANRLLLLGSAPGGGNEVGITAPIGGQVESRPANAGQVVAAGEPIAAILNARSVWVESDIFEKDLPRIRVGQRVAIGADAVPGRTFEGTISHIGAEVNPATRAVRVRTVVLNTGEVLKPNMFVRVIISSGKGSAVTIPREALQEQGGQPVVFVAESEGVYRRRPVRIGPTLGDQVVVESGLREGERVVTRGSYQLLARVTK